MYPDAVTFISPEFPALSLMDIVPLMGLFLGSAASCSLYMLFIDYKSGFGPDPSLLKKLRFVIIAFVGLISIVASIAAHIANTRSDEHAKSAAADTNKAALSSAYGGEIVPVNGANENKVYLRGSPGEAAEYDAFLLKTGSDTPQRVKIAVIGDQATVIPAE